MQTNTKKIADIAPLAFLVALGLTACQNPTPNPNTGGSLKLKVLTGSALGQFCDRAAQKFNQTNPKFEDGTGYQVECEAEGSGDVVNRLESLATQLKNGSLSADSDKFPTVVSVDGESYQNQLIEKVDRIFTGQNYIPKVTESPLLAFSPVVFMVPSEVADTLTKVPDPYRSLTRTKSFKDLAPQAPNILIKYVQTAPTKSNSGLQALIAQFASVSGKRPEDLTVADVAKYKNEVALIQSKVTRYGVSTDNLAKSMVKNGTFWASIGSVYESSAIAANSENTTAQKYRAVYPKSTFLANMRAILPTAPWNSSQEIKGAEKFIEYMRSPEIQTIATELGLRPGIPGVPLGAKFTPEFGADPNAKFEALKAPKTEVVSAMLDTWQQTVKKPSLVVIIVDSSGSMSGDKLPAVQSALQSYMKNLGPLEKVALIDFDSEIKSPILADGTPGGKDRGLSFINSLQADGETKLYDAITSGQDWLKQNYRKEAINAVLVLTDGQDSGSSRSLNDLKAFLARDSSSDRRIGFFTIGYGKKGDFNDQILQEIANSSGGYYSQGDPSSIDRIIANLQVEF
jgi:Ca-activated chloride channel homolog